MMDAALPYLWLIPALPFFGAGLMFFLGRTIESPTDLSEARPSRVPGIVCSIAVAISFVVACGFCLELYRFPGQRFELRGGPWFAGGEWGLLLDPLSAELVLLVSGIGTLVHLYSTAYMSRDGGQYRFFGALNFFVAMMQVLVLANNYVLLFAGWEGVGFASYLLIGFYYRRWQAGIAGMKAFVINRAGDAAMLLGILFLLAKAGTTRFADVQASAANWEPVQITLAATLLLIGALGKSAQFPLHIWLPDAMEGPTPVSALIHSATMVCAGVYLIARSSFLFAHAPEVSLATAIVGIISALLAATIALVENDIKRVLAYSTISQIGFMFVALGAGAYTAALFHLFTHAFFKSLLFLGSGSIIHALQGEQNLKHMGGLRKHMPWTFRTMMLAALALSAVPGFAGFFSKDAIIGSTLHLPNGWLFLAASLFTSLLTACYSWRLIFLAFFGEPHADTSHAHESPWAMTAPMLLLGAACIAAGWAPSLIHWTEWPLMLVSALLALAGIALARRYYLVTPESRRGWDQRFGPLIRLLRNRWYIDALYEEQILNGIILRTAEGASLTDELVIDGAANATSWLTRKASGVLGWFDRNVVDGFVRISSTFIHALSSPTRGLQTGFVQTYALLFVVGVLAALGYYLSVSLR
jgi:NADH-quinone oxidoreductase subunit L